MTTIKSLDTFIFWVNVILELKVNSDSIKVVFFETNAFRVNGTAVYKNGVLLLPIFLF